MLSLISAVISVNIWQRGPSKSSIAVRDDATEVRCGVLYCYFFSYSHPLTRCPPPAPPPPISDKEEVPDNEEGVEDTAADVDDTTVNDAAPEDTTIPPRLVRKPPASAKKATKKAESNDIAAVLPPTTKPPANYSIDSTEKHFISYYVKGKSDIVDVVFLVNGVVHDTEYRVTVAADRKSVTLKRGIHSFCFSKKLLRAILGGKFSSSSHRAIAYDDIAQEMQDENLRPENQLFWGAL